MVDTYSDEEERIIEVLAWVEDGRLPVWEYEAVNACTRKIDGHPRRVWLRLELGKPIEFGLTRFGRRELDVWRKAKEVDE